MTLAAPVATWQLRRMRATPCHRQLRLPVSAAVAGVFERAERQMRIHHEGDEDRSTGGRSVRTCANPSERLVGLHQAEDWLKDAPRLLRMFLPLG